MVNHTKEEAIANIKKESNKANVESIGCDLGNFGEVKDVFDGVHGKEQRLDLVCSITLRIT